MAARVACGDHSNHQTRKRFKEQETHLQVELHPKSQVQPDPYTTVVVLLIKSLFRKVGILRIGIHWREYQYVQKIGKIA